MAFDDKSENLGAIIIKKPRITERATLLQGARAYTFVVDPRANKKEIARAVEDLYKVRPTKVNIINVPERRVSGRGRGGMRSGFKKAIVFLKEGDKIDVI